MNLPRVRISPQTALLVALMCIVAYFAFEHLAETPPIWYDEGIYSQTAQNAVAHAGAPRMQIAPGTFESAWNSSGGFPFIYPVALSYALLGDSVFAGRLAMALFLLLFCGAWYVLMRRLYGTGVALLSLMLLSTFPVLYGTGKSVLGEVPGLLYLALFLLLFARVEEERFRSSTFILLLCGLFLGLTAVTKPLFLLVPAALLMVALFNIRRIEWAWRWVLIGSSAALVPVLFHTGIHLLDAPVSVLAEFYANPYAVGDVRDMMLKNAGRFFTEASPLHCAFLFALWGARLLWCRYRRIPVALAEQTAFILSVLVLFFYLRTAGWYRYFFVADVLSLAFAPLSLITLRDAAAELLPRLRPYLTTAMMLAIGGLFALHTHALLYSSWIAEHRSSTSTAELISRLSSIGPETSVALIDVPELAILMPHRSYYQYLRPTDVFEVGTSTLVLVAEGVPDLLIMRSGQATQSSVQLDQYTQASSTAQYVFYYAH